MQKKESQLQQRIRHYLTENEISELNEIALNVIKKKGFKS